jgi:general secretion pathway protein A
MYTSFFALNEKPFSITPNPRYLYMSERHTEALAHLIYGIKDSGGFIQLTGEVGTGKTTLIRSLLQRLPKNADVAVILNPQLSATEFLKAILTELHIPIPEQPDSLKELTDALNQFLLENHSNGRRTILIVDEAQNFAIDVLEQIRLLTNLETAQQKLLQITLIGQPELKTMLARPDLRQLAQRITGRYHLQPLSQADTELYVGHRLKVAGTTEEIFTTRACRELYRLSGGVPRIINVIADRAMLGAYTTEQHEIGPGLVRRAAAEVYGKQLERGIGLRMWLQVVGVACGAAALIGIAVYAANYLGGAPPSQPAVSAVEAPITEQSIAVAETADPQLPAVRATGDDVGKDANGNRALEDFLRANADRTDTKSAFQGLFDLWGEPFDVTAKLACKFAQQYQLFCLFQKGSLAQVQRLDRPVILTLQDKKGGTHQVVLVELNAEAAVISAGGPSKQIPVTDLVEHWYGEYLLLWKPQIGAVKEFYPGMRDPDVVWLRKSLATIQGDPIDPMDSDYFDAALETRVRNYQVMRRLIVDGLVAQQTQILINSDLGASAPRLTRAN